MAEGAKTGKNIAPACKGCLRWEQFGRKCHYYWDLKKECSMFAASPEDF